MKLKFARWSLLVFLGAPCVLALDAPTELQVGRIQSGAWLLGFPQAHIDVPNAQERPPMAIFHFKGGARIDAASALDENVRSGRDTRLVPGNITCTVAMERASTPHSNETAQLDGRPGVGANTYTFASGRTLSVQKAVLSFSVYDRWTSTHNKLTCYKVGEQPLTVADLKSALGSSFKIQLSDAQAQSMATFERMRNAISQAGTSVSDSRGPAIVDSDSEPRPVPQPAQDDDEVVSTQRSGSVAR